MKRQGRGTVPAVSATTPLAPDVSAPAQVDPAVACATTAVAQAITSGEVDLNPAPIVDTSTDEVRGADAVAIATAAAEGEKRVDPLVKVPGTQALPADQITPKLPASEVMLALESDATLADVVERLNAIGVRLVTIERGVEDALDQILLMPGDEFDAKRDFDALVDEVAGKARRQSQAIVDGIGDAVRDILSDERRSFPVAYAIMQSGRIVQPHSRDRVRLTSAEHRHLASTGAVSIDWHDGELVDDEEEEDLGSGERR